MPRSKKLSAAKSTPKRTVKKRVKKSSGWHFPISARKTLFILGAFLVLISLLYHIEQVVNLSFYHQALPIHTAHVTSRPVEIKIDAVDIDLPVVETVIANNTWQIADNGISHLAQSSRPGEDGTIIVYGHNTNDRFGPLLWLHIGDTVTLTNTDNKIYTYTIKQIVTVDPADTKILTSQKGQTLILYTCTGFADLKRYVLIAKPQP